MKLFALLCGLYYLDIVVDTSSAQVNMMASNVSTKKCVLSEIKSGKSPQITISYTLENHSEQVQVLSRYCTIRLSVSIKGHNVPLRNSGRNATRKISASDIIVLNPGNRTIFTVRVGFSRDQRGGLVMMRGTEDGSWWVSEPLPLPGDVEILAAYDSSIARDQSGFNSLTQDVESIIHNSVNTKYVMAEKIEFSPVKIVVTE